VETKTGSGKSPPPLTRLEQLKQGKAKPELPPNPAPHITEWLFDIGPSQSNGMGEVPISWQEMDHWQRVVGIELQRWEAQLLRRLSRDFVAARHDARKNDAPSPMDQARTPAEQDAAVEKVFAMWIKAFSKPKKPKVEKPAP
jgi:hypothetical protein